MKEDNVYLNYLIGDLESFVFSKRKEIDRIINEKEILNYTDSIYIFNNLAEGLNKTTNLIKHLKETQNPSIIRDICILSSEIISWIIFTLPSLERGLELFSQGFHIKEKHIIDILGENLIILDEIIEKPEKLNFFYGDILLSIQNVNMGFGYIQKIIEKGEIEN